MASIDAIRVILASVPGARGHAERSGAWRQRDVGPPPATAIDRRGGGFGARYWVIVALETASIVAGGAVLRAVGLESATVAWVSMVVGVHFLALAAVWRLSLSRPLGTAIALCGTAAIAAATAGAAAAWVAGIGGVLPGGLLLCAAASRATPATPGCPEPPSSAAGRG